jgi:hypothetical protein
MRQKLKGAAIGAALWVGLITLGNPAQAKVLTFMPNGVVTMDVVKEDGQGTSGTWLCPSLRDCYTKVLEAEERGATQYCRSITIKRDGKIVWHRDYNAPYWVGTKSQHDNWW